MSTCVVSALLVAGCGDDTESDHASEEPAAATLAPVAPAVTEESSDDDTGATTTTTVATGPDRATLDAVAVELEELLVADQPTAVATRPGDPALYWTEVKGALWAEEPGGDRRLVLDLVGEVSLDGEQGLFGLDFSPDGELLYVSFTDLDGRSRVVELAMAGGVADRATWRDVLVVDQPAPLHNGGHVHVDAGGLLWVGLGDGGVPLDTAGNAQSLDTLLGKLLRIDPRPTADAPYEIPDGNPYADGVGGRPEIWAHGLRNPWRFAVDEPTGDVWIGDVGQYDVEEIDLLPGGGPGSNLGWPALEGSRPVDDRVAPEDALPPLLEYGHDDGRCSVTAGYLYRGDAIDGLSGAFLFADLCDAQVRALSQRDGEIVAERRLELLAHQPVSILPDADGEPLVVSMAGPIYRIVPAD